MWQHVALSRSGLEQCNIALDRNVWYILLHFAPVVQTAWGKLALCRTGLHCSEVYNDAPCNDVLPGTVVYFTSLSSGVDGQACNMTQAAGCVRAMEEVIGRVIETASGVSKTETLQQLCL